MQHPFGNFDEARNNPGNHLEKGGNFHPGRVENGADRPDVGGNSAVDVEEAVIIGQVARQQDLSATLKDVRVFGQSNDASTREVRRLP